MSHMKIIIYLFVSSLLLVEMASAQELGLASGREPRGVQVYEMALTPTQRKWQHSQSLYQFYRWTGDEYSNYAEENYERYVSEKLEGFRTYDIYGNYVTRGFEIYSWTANSPTSAGTSVRKAPKFSGWFRNLVVSSMSKGQFYSALTIGDAISTTLTPLTFRKPAFNGLQWDFASDRFAATLIASRLASPGTVIASENSGGQNLSDVTNLYGLHATASLGDFSRLGFSYINIANFASSRRLGNNSVKGVLTEDQNGGHVETIVLRLSDDSPEDGKGGAQLFSERIFLNGVEHPEIVPTVRGGFRRSGLLEADGAESIELTYNIISDFAVQLGEDAVSFQDVREIEFELVIANDYKIEVTSNLQINSQDEPVFLLVERTHGNVRDGSNMSFVRFKYGLPTGKDILGVNFDVEDFQGFNLRSEWAITRNYRRFPNQNFRDHKAAQDEGVAYYVTASQDAYPYFVYGEVYRLEPEYSTQAFITDTRGFIDYEDPERYSFEAIDDNDDQDRFPDWKRLWQNGDFLFGTTKFGTGGLPDPQVFPGYDENSDFISDFNQNDNSMPDFAEPFLRYNVDSPEFLFGVDMNNNGIVDRFENDNLADFPYRQDRGGYNAYGGMYLTENLKLTVGRAGVGEISSKREANQTYAIATGHWNWPWAEARFYQYARFVQDDIQDNAIIWVDPNGFREIVDPLETENAFVNTGYLTFDYLALKNLNIYNKVKYDWYKQRGDAATTRDNRLFLGLINKVDYPMHLSERVTLWPRWKSIFRNVDPQVVGESPVKEWSHFFMLTSKYYILPTTFLEYGVEFNVFANLEDKPEIVPPGYIDDFTGTVLALQLTNRSSYLGYALTMNAGFRWDRRAFEAETDSNSLLFIRVFAGLQR